jgi:hypothetical protein
LPSEIPLPTIAGDVSLKEIEMKKIALTLTVCALAISFAALRAKSDTKSMTGFDRMKSLTGEWSGQEAGNSMTSSIRLVSNGTAIEEIFHSGEAHEMVTLYSRDGDKLAMIHLCEMGNQPRMETESLAENSDTFDFSFTGGTNLKSRDDLHMDHMTLHVIDKDHFDETWTARQNGKDVEKALFHFTRKS